MEADNMSSDRATELRKEMLKREIERRQAANQKEMFNRVSGESNGVERAGRFAEENFNKPFEKFVANPAMEAGAGFGQGLANILPGAANLGIKAANLIPGMNISERKAFDVVPHGLPQQAGELGSFFSSSGVASNLSKLPQVGKVTEKIANAPSIQKILAGAKENIPGIEKLLQALTSSTGKSVAGNATLNALMSPEHQGSAALLGGAFGAAGPALAKFGEPVKQGIEKLKDYFSPGKQAKELMEKIGGGAKNAEEASKSIAKDLQEGHAMREAEVKPYFNHAFKQAGNEKIFEAHNPLIRTGIDKEKEMVDKLKEFNLGKVYDSFKKDTNFKNAHEVQSELGTRIGDLQRTPHKTPEQRKELNSLVSTRNELKKDINRFLTRHDSTSNLPIKDTYKAGIDLYREHVAPYLSSKKLRDLTKGGKEYIKNIHNIFEFPAGKIDKSGKLIKADTNKILEDMPPEMREKILFSKVGGMHNARKPGRLIKEFNKAENKGFSTYFSDDLKKQLSDITSKKSHQNILKLATGGGAGLLLEEYLRSLVTGNHANHGE
jgi:hypothetical protein